MPIKKTVPSKPIKKKPATTDSTQAQRDSSDVKNGVADSVMADKLSRISKLKRNYNHSDRRVIANMQQGANARLKDARAKLKESTDKTPAKKKSK